MLSYQHNFWGLTPSVGLFIYQLYMSFFHWRIYQLYTDTHTTKLYIETFVFMNYTCLPWQLTPVFLPGESHGQKSLAGHGVHGVTKSWTQLKWLSMHACIGVKLLNYIWIYKLYACVLFVYMYRQTLEILRVLFQTMVIKSNFFAFPVYIKVIFHSTVVYSV